jgi:hypothetical protein
MDGVDEERPRVGTRASGPEAPADRFDEVRQELAERLRRRKDETGAALDRINVQAVPPRARAARWRRFVRGVRPRLTVPLAISLLALFVATGGPARAGGVVVIADNDQLAAATVAGHNTPDGARANIIAGSVSGRDLAPKFWSSLEQRCPKRLGRAGDICFEHALRAGATLETALRRCAAAGLRMPTAAELALAFERLRAPQPSQWTAAVFMDSTYGTDATAYGAVLRNGRDRSLVFGWAASRGAVMPYRCVTSPAR